MTVSEEFQQRLDEHFNWEETNIPNLNRPVLLIFDYSPTDGAQPFSFAFEPGASKCWITHNKIKLVDDIAPPAFHAEYGEFSHKKHHFYPYSIQVPPDTFANIQEFKNTCNRLYNHIDQA